MNTENLNNLHYINNENINNENKNNENRSENQFMLFWKVILLIGIFYSIPSMQYIIYQEMTEMPVTFQYTENNITSNVTVSSVCRFNYKCHHNISNNIVSNIFYLIFGGIHWLFTYKKNKYIKNHYLHYALSACLVLEGIFSAMYHMCPSNSNFQFDSTFMIVMSGMLIITYISKRNVNMNFEFFRVFCFLALLVAISSAQLGYGSKNWILNTLWVMSYLMYMWITNGVAFNLLYPDVEFKIGIKFIMKSFFIQLCQGSKISLIFIIILNAANITMLILSLATSIVYSIIYLSIMLLSSIITIVNYIYYKSVEKKETITKNVICMYIVSIIFITLGIYYFSQPTYAKYDTVIESYSRNRPCIFLNYFDTHDMWHMFSAFGIFAFLQATWWIDATSIYTNHREQLL